MNALKNVDKNSKYYPKSKDHFLLLCKHCWFLIWFFFLLYSFITVSLYTKVCWNKPEIKRFCWQTEQQKEYINRTMFNEKRKYYYWTNQDAFVWSNILINKPFIGSMLESFKGISIINQTDHKEKDLWWCNCTVIVSKSV